MSKRGKDAQLHTLAASRLAGCAERACVHGALTIVQPRQKELALSPQAMNLERWARIFGVVGWHVPLGLRYMQPGCVCYLLATGHNRLVWAERTIRTQKRLWLELAGRESDVWGAHTHAHTARDGQSPPAWLNTAMAISGCGGREKLQGRVTDTLMQTDSSVQLGAMTTLLETVLLHTYVG